MNTNILIGIIAIVLIGGGAYAYMQSSKSSMDDSSESMMNKDMDDSLEKDDSMMDDDMKKEKGMDDSQMDESSMMEKGVYEAYSPEKLSRAEEGDVVLFFHASWCPSCKGLNADIENNLEAIPQGVSILKVDYDTETELKLKYGVTYQHTLVQVDSNGELIKKWSGSPTLLRLASEIQ